MALYSHLPYLISPSKNESKTAPWSSRRSVVGGFRICHRDIALIILFVLNVYLYLKKAPGPPSHASPITPGSALDASPLGSPSQRRSKIATIGMFYGDGEIAPIYKRTMANQRAYSERHGYETIMLRTKVMPRLWSKPAFMHTTIINELQKPKEDRLEWLFWLDTDIIMMNPKIPLEAFLPPSDSIKDVNLIVSNDLNGLNVGTYLVRVHSWSAQLYAEALALPNLRPEVPLKYSDQSAVEWLVKQDRFRNQTVIFPQVFCNAYIGDRGDAAELRKQTKDGVREGDLLIHFAGKPEKAKSRLELYMGIAESHDPKWEVPFEKTQVSKDLVVFWGQETSRRANGNFAAGSRPSVMI